MVAMVTDPSSATTSPSSAPQAARPAIATRPRATSPVWNFVLNSFIFSSLGPPERGWKTTVLQVTTLSIGDTNLVLRSCKRSEEHTSELQSLMRISYAVFYLQKKKQSPLIP